MSIAADERKYMELAIEEMRRDPRKHKVGAVVVKGDKFWSAHGQQVWDYHHAESALLMEVVPATEDFKGAILYTTLEPCTTRHHPNRECALLIRERHLGRVVIGILDPNPRIFGRGRMLLRKYGIEVGEFDEDLKRVIEEVNIDWIRSEQVKTSYEEIFSVLASDHISLKLAEYAGPAVQGAITIRLCPDITRGWLMSEVQMRHDTARFPLPVTLQNDYKTYFSGAYATKGFDVDNPKIMVKQTRPVSFTDSPPLKLETQETLYSHVQFYKDMVAPIDETRRQLIRSALVGEDRQMPFPHALCLHLVVATYDDKLLITKRAPEVEYYPNTWSCSLEENMALKDLSGDPDHAVLQLGKRALLEELGLGDDAYQDENLRILSVFLESEILNASLCGFIKTNLTADQLRRILRGMPRRDYEFVAWDFLNYEPEELITEIRSPSLAYHPTTRYRLLMALMHREGMPRFGERWFTAVR